MVTLAHHYGIALILLAFGVSCYGGQDTPVRSTNGGKPGAGIEEGVAGRVMARDDRPVTGALVQPKSIGDPSPPIPEIAILTGDDGRYTWPLFPGAYEITVSAEGYRRVTKRVTVEAGRVATLDFTLERAP